MTMIVTIQGAVLGEGRKGSYDKDWASTHQGNDRLQIDLCICGKIRSKGEQANLTGALERKAHSVKEWK